jgi:hypothetical protein
MVATMNAAPNATASRKDGENAGSHWYEYRAGHTSPLYKEGGVVTLREARKYKTDGKVVLPSVTTIFKCLHKQMLVDWLMGQAAVAATKFDRSAFSSESDWLDAVLGAANNSSRGAMDLGTRIHKAIELGLEGGEYDADMEVYAKPTFAKLEEIKFKLVAQEICVANPKVGYAGRCDLLGEMEVLDAKSRKTTPGRKVRGYGTDLMQLLAYGVAHYGPDFLTQGVCRNVVISTTEPGRVEIITHDPNDYARAWDAFLGLTAVWRFESNFDPRIQL